MTLPLSVNVVMPDVVIRKYEERDRKALRQICCDTAYFGEPCEAFFPDRELLADLVMNYYTDCEFQHTWVAETQGEVIGYVSGCFNGARHSRCMFLKIAPAAFLRALRRGKIWDKKTLRLLFYNLKAFILRETALDKIDPKKFTGHIHQNIKDGFRGQGVGGRLLKALFSEAAGRLYGISFRPLRQEKRFDFFEKFGCRRLDCRRVKSWESWLAKKPLYFMEYVKEFDA